MARTATRTAAPATTPVQGWAPVAHWVVRVVVFVAWVWFIAPARFLWSERWVRVIAWCGLLPLVWRIVRFVVRATVGPLLVVAWLAVSERRELRPLVKAIRKGSRKGRKYGRRVSRTIYGPSVL